MQYLVITRDNGTVNWNSYDKLLKQEAKHIWELQKAGTVRNIWFTKNEDAILILEGDNEEQIKEIVASFPLIRKGLLVYSIEELSAYTGFERLYVGTD